MKPLNGEKMWRKTKISGMVKFLPPLDRRMPGRPRRNRRKDPHESPKKPGHLSRKGAQMHCSNCKEVGHNKKGCKKAFVPAPPPAQSRNKARKKRNTVQTETTPTDESATTSKKRVKPPVGFGVIDCPNTGDQYIKLPGQKRGKWSKKNAPDVAPAPGDRATNAASAIATSPRNRRSNDAALSSQTSSFGPPPLSQTSSSSPRNRRSNAGPAAATPPRVTRSSVIAVAAATPPRVTRSTVAVATPPRVTRSSVAAATPPRVTRSSVVAATPPRVTRSSPRNSSPSRVENMYAWFNCNNDPSPSKATRSTDHAGAARSTAGATSSSVAGGTGRGKKTVGARHSRGEKE